MKTVGIVAEYNPFHNGHKYHIEQALQVSHAKHAYVVMSGDFVQRGEPAIMPKYLRTQMALTNGASIVAELPVSYATGSAQYFAEGAVAILNEMNCDAICFGSECGDLELLWPIAKLLHEDPPHFNNILQEKLKLGHSFPLSRAKAISHILCDDKYDEILASPNNILGIEYLKALLKTNSKMEAFTIKRSDKGYHSDSLEGTTCSALALRMKLQDNESAVLSTLSDFIPANCDEIMKEEYGCQYPVMLDFFSDQLQYKLLYLEKKELSNYLDVNEGLANKIKSCFNQYTSFSRFIEELKTKDLTYSRISRALLHILLDIKQEDARQELSYLRILGFRKQDEQLLGQIKRTSNLPLITRPKDFDKLSAAAYQTALQNLHASSLYQIILRKRYGKCMQNEYERMVLKI